MAQEESVIASLDLGSSKVVALVARVHRPEEIELIGLGIAPSHGIKTGAVTNIELTSRSIREAIEEAELMSATQIESVVINVTGKHVRGDNSTGVIAITNRERVVTSNDIYRVIDAAQAIRIPADQEILHVLSREFKVDDQNGIKDPLGMVGVRLEADVHIVTGGTTQLQNLDKAVEQAGLYVRDRVLSSLASSHAILSDGEKELGVAVADIGAGVIDIIVYTEGGVAYTTTICLGAHHITQDISIGLKTPLEAAEMLKKRYGSVLPQDIDPSEMIEVPSVGDRPPRLKPRRELAEIMEARMREMLEMIDHELLKSGKKNLLAGGIIFTGGGSLVEGLIPLAEEIIGLGASLGAPKGLLGIADRISSPVFSTAVGLILHELRANEDGIKKTAGRMNFVRKIKSWLQNNL
ncbi:MAG: cell division protein FtsA [Leptospiraceae bacterium]|nr:cell division protein FtsA [Leptospiraceae bacterium]MDW8305543.1 cell division protein FtsA [Leptospiraceae bacterium]